MISYIKNEKKEMDQHLFKGIILFYNIIFIVKNLISIRQFLEAFTK